MITELRVAQGVADGVLDSPTNFYGSGFFDIRISGTGVAYRLYAREYCYRDPDIWLSADMQRRWLGAPVLVEHPPGGLLTTYAFATQCVGTVLFTYVDEIHLDLRGVARIVDSNAFAMLAEGKFDTSPAVRFNPGIEASFIEHDGARIRVEGVPILVDHVALVATDEGNKGVWTRGEELGVDVSTRN